MTRLFIATFMTVALLSLPGCGGNETQDLSTGEADLDTETQGPLDNDGELSNGNSGSEVFLIENEEDLKRLWYPDPRKYDVLKEGEFKAGETIQIEFKTTTPRMIGIDTDVFWNKSISWDVDQHSIEMKLTNSDAKLASSISRDGLGFGNPCEPVNGVIQVQFENKSDKQFKYAIYVAKE